MTTSENNPPTNKTAGTVSTVVGDVGNTIVSMAEKLAIADYPVLAAPIFKQLWEAVFGFIAGYFIKAAQTGATFAVIDIQVGNEESNISKALAALIAAEKSGDPNAIKQAIQNYADANSALIHDDGSVPLH